MYAVMDDAQDQDIKCLREQVRLQQGTLDSLKSMIEGLNHELRLRDIRIAELEKKKATLLKRVQERGAGTRR